ncbi:magnesium/cobalt transporter CorA [Aquibacillus koreensis]|uniref:Magnesium transport protein CorA n=1 Tax=Aquibacillus koreensis TaxID=279446 RepID=A0A9X3WH35_9BACI|nr:magnesium/cobalt transporter CorA [Aquibacillus koreensis]MCT2535280.1 magnesium/cobalt transporter CorA [Aquibacillus koreensis]MDC3419787.1 magnesium/cobalt transporter CorA [Aquibacillus koreensis]
MIQIIAITNNQLHTPSTIDELKQHDYDWYWIDFDQPTDDEIKQLDEKLHFHPLAIEDCIHELQRPKLDYYDDFNFFTTHAINPKDLSKQEHDFFLGENFIVSYHNYESSEINQAWRRLSGVQDVSKWDHYRIFYEVLDKIVDNYFPIIYEIEDELNSIENNDDQEAMEILLDNLFDIRHELLKLRHTINPVRDLFYRMLNSHRLKGIRDRREYFTDIYDHLLKLSEMVASNREIANDIRDNYLSLNSHQTNQVMKLLTIITSIFVPLTFIVGIYGMNFENMPELSWQYGYFAVLILMVVITVLMVIYFKRKGWF